MSGHDTNYPVWAECLDHREPDAVEGDPRYDCAGSSGCVGFPLADWVSVCRTEFGYVLCSGCTTFHAEQEGWEASHERGEDADGRALIIGLHGEPFRYCRECSADAGEWVTHTGPGGEASA